MAEVMGAQGEGTAPSRRPARFSAALPPPPLPPRRPIPRAPCLLGREHAPAEAGRWGWHAGTELTGVPRRGAAQCRPRARVPRAAGARTAERRLRRRGGGSVVG